MVQFVIAEDSQNKGIYRINQHTDPTYIFEP